MPERVAEITAGTEAQPSAPEFRSKTIIRPPLGDPEAVSPAWSGDPTSWLAPLQSWLEQQGVQVTAAVEADARRLLGGGRYRHALIAAVNALENTLRTAVRRAATPPATRPAMPTSGSLLSVLLETARQRQTLSEADCLTLREAQAARNAVSHRPGAIQDAEAKRLTEFTLDVVTRLKASPGAT